MNEREAALQRLRWSLERLRFLHSLGALAPEGEVTAAWAEHVQVCRWLTRIGDGARR